MGFRKKSWVQDTLTYFNPSYKPLFVFSDDNPQLCHFFFPSMLWYRALVTDIKLRCAEAGRLSSASRYMNQIQAQYTNEAVRAIKGSIYDYQLLDITSYNTIIYWLAQHVNTPNIQGIETSIRIHGRASGLSMKFFHEIHGWLLRSFKDWAAAT